MRIAELTILVSAACGVAYGQVAPGANRMNTPQTAPPLVRAETSTVLVDVVATKKGQAVLGLDRKQFHVFEDGREQAIGFFEEHKPIMGQQVVQRRALPPHTYDNIPSQPPGSAVNVLLLDALNTPLGNQVQVRKQMVQYLETIKPGTMMAIFTLSSRLRMVQGFTSDAGVLASALKSAKTTPYRSAPLSTASDFNSLVGDLQMSAGPGTAGALAAIQGFQGDVAESRTNERLEMTLKALEQLARYLSAVPGRKNLIWFSGAFPIMSNPESVRYMGDMLAAARIAVYPMSAEGLATLATFDLANDGLGGGPHNADPGDHFTMETMASLTGGMAFFNNNGFAQGVANAIDNGSSYYTIGYVPTDKNFHGQFRKLKVRVDGCGCELEYRSGYYADPPDKLSSIGLPQASVMATATMHGAPPSTQILFQVRVLPETDPLMKDVHLPAKPIGAMAEKMKKPFTRYITDFAIDPRTLVFAEESNGDREDAIEFTLVGYDAEGKRVNYVDRTAHLSLTASQYAQLAASGLPARLALEMPAGQDFLVVAVHDLNSTRVGSIEIPVTVKKK